MGEDPDVIEGDTNPTVEFVCFGPVAEELIGSKVEALIQLGGGTGFYTPRQITRLERRTYAVRATVPRGSLRRERPSFKIDTIISMAVLQEVETSVNRAGISPGLNGVWQPNYNKMK